MGGLIPASLGRMSAAMRMRLVVALLAVAAGGAVAGIVLATRQTPAQPKAQCGSQKPVVVPGVGSPQAAVAVRAAGGSLRALEGLAHRFPGSAAVQFNYGVALQCHGYLSDAVSAYEAAKRTGRDTLYEVDADNLLHPQFFQGGYPIFQPTRPQPLLLRGVVLQREGHQHSAERLYARAARLYPKDDEAQVAAAVGRFDEDDLSASFSHLGPLVRTFPRSQSVRFHLGLLLAWTGQGDQAVLEFRQARALGPATALGSQAEAFLKKLVANGTTRTHK
jgi:tetratricopeptide (TPR) repeat protein